MKAGILQSEQKRQNNTGNNILELYESNKYRDEYAKPPGSK